MFYELSNKRRMECERYQDCSWFQQDSMKGSLNNKLSPVESFDPFIDADEFDLPMQIVNAQIIPWDDEHLEVFDDDILLEKGDKLKEKSKNFRLSNGNLCKGGDDCVFDTYNVNFSLRKTDSFDSMKNVSLTNPADIIPISYKEKLNISNFGVTNLGDIKSEIKQEVELYSPESNSYLMDSDDNDLNIGREEEVTEETNSSETVDVVDCDNYKEQENNSEKPDNASVSIKVEQKLAEQKFDLNLDFGKLNFEQSLSVNTPDLDFMDLVEFINEEMRQENVSNANQISTKGVTKNSVQKENSKPEVMNPKFSSPQVTIKYENPVEEKVNSTINLNEIFNTGVSIAERIKTTTKRNTRKSFKDIINSEDEDRESLDYEDDDDDDDDEDYDYSESVAKRKCAPIKRRSKSSASESSVNSKRIKDVDSYREKRDKNNEASRRSRLNRKARERHMYETLEDEEKRNVKLKAEADILEKQVSSLRQLLLQVVLRKGSGT